jgi:hypothetical protein
VEGHTLHVVRRRSRPPVPQDTHELVRPDCAASFQQINRGLDRDIGHAACVERRRSIILLFYKCHLSEKVGAVCVQTLQVRLRTAVSAKTKTAPAAALTFTNTINADKLLTDLWSDCSHDHSGCA